MTESPKISILVPNVKAGGAEKMMTKLAVGLASENLNVDLLVLADNELQSIPDKISNLKIITFSKKRVLFSVFHLFKYLLKQKPKIIISSHNRINILVLGYKKLFSNSTNVVIRESNTFSEYYTDKKKFYDRLINFAALKLYKFCDLSVAVSNGVEDDLRKNVKIEPEKLRMIYNPAVDNSLFKLSEEPVDLEWLNNKKYPVVIAAGRVSTQKDFPTLLKAFNIVQKKKDSRLIILGYEKEDKTEFARLLNLISEFKIEDKVRFTGYVNNPFAYMSRSDVFVLSSRYEGLPGVLIQALACGLSSVSTDCPSGPREILANGKFGKLVPIGDYNAMAEAILESIANPDDKNNLIERASEFSVTNSIKKYVEVIYELIDKSCSSYNGKTKVVHFINSYVPGGAEVLVKDIVLKQSKSQDVQIWGMHKSYDQKFSNYFEEQLQRAGIKTIPTFGNKPNRGRIKRIISIHKAIKKHQPDVINTHSEAITAYVVIASIGNRVKIVQTIHSVKILFKNLQKYFLKYTIDKYVTISKICNQALIDDINVSPEKIELIYNGIELKKFQIKRRKINKKVNNILAIGRLTIQKDFETLLKAYSILKNICVTESIELPKLNIVGSGELKEVLVLQRDSLKLTNDIIFWGVRNDVPELLYKNDILVMSSIYEGLSIALLEAISTGIPVVATNVGGNMEIIENEINGLLVESKEPGKLADALFQMINEFSKRNKFSKNSLTKSSKFNIENTVRGYTELHEQLTMQK